MPELNLDKVCDLLHKRGIKAYVEQTGGGCATIFAGPTHIDEYGDERYAAVAGPGWFAGPGWLHGRATTDEFGVGRDDDGTDPGVMADKHWSEHTAARAIAKIVSDSVPIQ